MRVQGDLPVAEAAAKETLALPTYPELTLAQQEYVVRTIGDFFLISPTEILAHESGDPVAFHRRRFSFVGYLISQTELMFSWRLSFDIATL
jgi:hypothetical protein